MSNTAIQRRADDIQRAGGNRALAFTNGSEASTPSVAPARVEPKRLDPIDVTSGLMMKKQIEAIDANIGLTKQQTDVAAATAANVRQNTITGANTATNLAQQTKNLEQALMNARATLQGTLSQNEISAIEARISKATEEQKIAIMAEALRKAKAEATSAEKKALLDQGMIDLMNFGKDAVNKLLKPKYNTGKSYRHGTYRHGRGTSPRNKPTPGYVPYEGY